MTKLPCPLYTAITAMENKIFVACLKVLKKLLGVIFGPSHVSSASLILSDAALMLARGAKGADYQIKVVSGQAVVQGSNKVGTSSLGQPIDRLERRSQPLSQ